MVAGSSSVGVAHCGWGWSPTIASNGLTPCQAVLVDASNPVASPRDRLQATVAAEESDSGLPAIASWGHRLQRVGAVQLQLVLEPHEYAVWHHFRTVAFDGRMRQFLCES